jgi:hypothetical protein
VLSVLSALGFKHESELNRIPVICVCQPFASAMFNRDRALRKVIENRGPNVSLPANQWVGITAIAARPHEWDGELRECLNLLKAKTCSPHPRDATGFLGFVLIGGVEQYSQDDEAHRLWGVRIKGVKLYRLTRCVAVERIDMPGHQGKAGLDTASQQKIRTNIHATAVLFRS